MSTAQRLAPEATNTRQRVLEEASSLFAERGFHGTSTRAIADAVGIRQPSLFYHFSSKAEILRELLAINLRYIAEVGEEMARARTPSPATRLYALLRWDFEEIERSPYDDIGLYAEWVFFDPAYAEDTARFERWVTVLRRLIARSVETAEMRQIDPDLMAHMVSGLAQGMMRHKRRSAAVDAGARAEAAATMVLGGALSRPEDLPRVKADGGALASTFPSRWEPR